MLARQVCMGLVDSNVVHAWYIYVEMSTAATVELRSLIQWYGRVLPSWTFPVLPLTIAAMFQSLAWLSGPILLSGLTLIPRILVLWLFAAGEYGFMSPSMNAAVEVLGMEEPALVVLYQVVTLVVYTLVHILIFKKPFRAKYIASFVLLALAVLVANL